MFFLIRNDLTPGRLWERGAMRRFTKKADSEFRYRLKVFLIGRIRLR